MHIKTSGAMAWMFVPLPKFICWYLMPIEKVLGGGAFGKWLGHEGRAFKNEITVLI